MKKGQNVSLLEVIVVGISISTFAYLIIWLLTN